MLARFVITFDVRSTEAGDERRRELNDALRAYQDAVHFQRSCWIVVSGLKPEQLYERLLTHLDPEDGDWLFVCQYMLSCPRAEDLRPGQFQ